jgi:signal transduction histidine kinase
VGSSLEGTAEDRDLSAGLDPRLGLAARAVVVAAGAAALLALKSFPAVVALGASLLAYGAASWWVARAALRAARRQRGGPRLSAAAVTEADAAIAAAVAVAWSTRSLPEIGVLAALPVVAVQGAARGWRADTAVGVVAGAAGIVGAAAFAHVGRSAAISGVAVVVGGILAWVGAEATTAAARTRTREGDLERARAEMVTTVSHELRTPLTVIQGAVATLSRRWDVLSEAERMDLVDVLVDNVASLDASILHFADAGRLERGTFAIAPAWIELGPIVTKVQAKLASALAGYDVRTEIEPGKIWADPAAVARIVEHLLVNAARFSPIGTPVRVRSAREGDTVVLSVADRGSGIPARLQSRVWLPLERGDVGETGVSRGAGLGLPIVRELARLHGGDAELTSVKGRGTTVRVTLPQPATAVR